MLVQEDRINLELMKKIMTEKKTTGIKSGEKLR